MNTKGYYYNMTMWIILILCKSNIPIKKPEWETIENALASTRTRQATLKEYYKIIKIMNITKLIKLNLKENKF
jgi:hypothetical protein